MYNVLAERHVDVVGVLAYRQAQIINVMMPGRHSQHPRSRIGVTSVEASNIQDGVYSPAERTTAAPGIPDFPARFSFVGIEYGDQALSGCCLQRLDRCKNV